MPKVLATVRSILIQAMNDTYAFEGFGGMTREETLSWFQDIVAPDIEKILSQRV